MNSNLTNAERISAERIIRLTTQNNLAHLHDDLDDVEPEIILVKTTKTDDELKAIFKATIESWKTKPDQLWGELMDVMAQRIGTVISQSDLSNSY